MTSVATPVHHGNPPTGSTGTTVELLGVVKQYGSARALDGISLALGPGEFVALLGPSGCGKTTALRSLAGLESIDEGRILIDGEDVSAVPTSRRDIGMVFQSYSLFPHMTVQQNVEFGLRMRRVRAGERRARALESLELVGLDHLADRYAHQLSGGQQQRVALARALVTRPRVLLLDEPLSALDAKVRVGLRDQIRRIQTELGITTLFVTHDQEEALAVADRVAVMRSGRIEQIGTPEELYSRPSSAFVADFVGLSNRIPGRIVGGEVDVHGARLPLLGSAADATIATPAAAPAATPAAAAPADGDEVLAYVRPEDIQLSAASPASLGVASSSPAIPGEVVATSFLGSIRRTSVRLDDGTLVNVQHAVADRPEPTERVGLVFRGAPVTVAPRP